MGLLFIRSFPSVTQRTAATCLLPCHMPEMIANFLLNIHPALRSSAPICTASAAVSAVAADDAAVDAADVGRLVRCLRLSSPG